MPWVTTTLLTATINRNSFQLGTLDTVTFDGPLCLSLATVTLVIGIVRLTTPMPMLIRRSTIITAIGIGIVLVDIYPGIHHLVQKTSQGASASIGLGFWICCVGAFLSLLGGLDRLL